MFLKSLNGASPRSRRKKEAQPVGLEPISSIYRAVGGKTASGESPCLLERITALTGSGAERSGEIRCRRRDEEEAKKMMRGGLEELGNSWLSIHPSTHPSICRSIHHPSTPPSLTTGGGGVRANVGVPPMSHDPEGSGLQSSEQEGSCFRFQDLCEKTRLLLLWF